jgi:two-component system, chemotaxis family, chemotaxis protein CheY
VPEEFEFFVGLNFRGNSAEVTGKTPGTARRRRLQTCAGGEADRKIERREKRMTGTTLLDVLIVDDSAAIRKILQRVLRQTEMLFGEIHEAGDGAEAVAILENHRVGLVLSDMNMPHMDGLELLAHIKEMAHMKNVPVIMITTEGSQGKVMEAVQLGATGYVRKPFTSEQIKEKLLCVLA